MVTAESVIEKSGLSLDPVEFKNVSFSEMPGPIGTLLDGRATAITLGDRVFVQPEAFDVLVAGARPDLVIHELVHVTQWRNDGKWFLPRYLGQYLRFRLLGIPHAPAYRSVSYEIEAFAASASS